HVPVKPTPASLVPREGRGRRPPEAIHARPVVATRAPHDPAPRLQRAGLNPSSQPAAPPPRVVQSPRGHAPGGAPAARAHGGAQTPQRFGETGAAAPPPPHGRGARGEPRNVAPTAPRQAGQGEHRAPAPGATQP